jgi:hypothetical protein
MSAIRRRRRRVEPTDGWDWLVSLFKWHEQKSYKVISPLVHLGDSVDERAEVHGVSQRTLHRRMKRFNAEGMGASSTRGGHYTPVAVPERSAGLLPAGAGNGSCELQL